MEYHKIINLLDNKNTQPSKIRVRNWVEITDDILEKLLTIFRIGFFGAAHQWEGQKAHLP